MENIRVKEEVIENSPSSSLVPSRKKNEDSTSRTPVSGPVIDLGSSSGSDSDFSSSSSSSDDDVGDIIPGTSDTKRSRASGEGGLSKKKLEKLGVVLPAGFLDPLPVKKAEASSLSKSVVPKAQLPNENANPGGNAVANVASCKQFWKAGDYDGNRSGDWDASSGGMDHLRVHPKFLHSNATSHKWVLGAFAELLDNAMDELGNGATLVNVDMLQSKKDGSRMLLIEDNGGGMDPDRIRHCMSLGYSVKSKAANTIGQYGNGFKTSTMRLGADVIVFSRCSGKTEKWSKQSIGLLSYTFLRSTGKEDIVVPMLDYERKGQEWRKLIRFSADEWKRNVETMVRWSPFSGEADLLQQFNSMGDQGTRIIIYNLWEDDQGLLELDFDSDPHDIQIRGVNRDERNIEMAKQFPNSRHFLTYQHSLRSYASILYLRIPAGFRIILRGKDVEHHNVVNDMMMAQEVTYRPQHGPDGAPKDQNMVAVVTIGFVKDAKAHIDVQGFNVYHKNRLIKPFWRLWHPPGSDGRGVIGVLEANFVEPAHDKQGFERTIVLSRLEAKLVQMQRTYWSTNCHKIGYAPRRNKRLVEDRDTSTDFLPETSSRSKKKSTPFSNTAVAESDKVHSFSNQKQGRKVLEKHHNALGQNHSNVQVSNKANKRKTPGKRLDLSEASSSSVEAVSDDDLQIGVLDNQFNSDSQKVLPTKKSSGKSVIQSDLLSPSLGKDVGRHEFPSTDLSPQTLEQLKEVNRELRDRLKRKEEDILGDLLHDLQNEREMCKCLETQLEDATRKVDELNKEQESLIDTFSEERERRDVEEENLRKKLKDASNTIQELLDKVRLLE